MNGIQETAVRRIGENWNRTGCAYETRESPGHVFLVVLTGRDLHPKGVALDIDAEGRTSWVADFPDNPERRYDR